MNIKDLLTAASRGCKDREVLLCWRGTIPREAFEIIAEDGHVVARELPAADSTQRFATVATQSCAGRALALNDAANLQPQVVSQPPVLVSELRDRQAEMEQEADMEQRKQQEAETTRLQRLRHEEETAEKIAMLNCEKMSWKRDYEAMQQKFDNVTMELQNAQAKEAEALRELTRRSEQSVEKQQASQEEGVARMQRAGEKQKGGSALAEPRHQSESTEEQRSNAASSHGSAASGRKTGRCLSPALLAWLKRHDLKGVHECDKHGWSALHHVAMDSKSETAVKGIFHELCNYEWSPMELDAETGEAPRSTHLPIGWTALHLLANGREYGRQRGQMAQRLLDMHANPMTLTARLTSPLHTAAGTGNIDVLKALLLHPGTDVNWKNKDNK
ncbi:MAG: hypothetical protein ACOVQL_01345, partial [Limnohabitans sp.]